MSSLHWWLLLLTLLLTGCETARHYSQAIHGHCQLLNQRQSIESMIQDPATPKPLKDKLRLTLQIRTFAETRLHLPANGHYLKYSALERDYVVWTVYAAPEFSLDPKSWRYPFVGRLSYRGYFAERHARDYAAKLKEKGYDVYVGGTKAYSTLGWFQDPVLSTFINDSELDLAELLFHELAHQVFFIPGDTDFNEAFATAVAEEGLRRWVEFRQNPHAAQVCRTNSARTMQFVELVTQTRSELEALYEHDQNSDLTHTHFSAEQTRRRKEELFQSLRLRYKKLRQTNIAGWEVYDAWFQSTLNNAKLNSVATYYGLVPAFHRLLQATGGDLEAFYAQAHALGKRPKEQRHRHLNELRNAAPSLTHLGPSDGPQTPRPTSASSAEEPADTTLRHIKTRLKLTPAPGPPVKALSHRYPLDNCSPGKLRSPLCSRALSPSSSQNANSSRVCWWVRESSPRLR